MIDQAFAGLFERCRSLGRPCMIGGSVASMVFGEPRATLDVDVIIDAGPADAEAMQAAFSEVDFYVPPLAVIKHELARGCQGMFNIIEHATGLKLDIYPAGDDPLIRFGLENRHTTTIAGVVVDIAPPEYVIAMKLRYFAMSGQDKHLRDIRLMLRISGPRIDRAVVQMWADRFGTRSAWDQVSS